MCAILSRNFQFFITPHLMVAFKIKYWKKLRILTGDGGGVNASAEFFLCGKMYVKSSHILL